MDAKVCPSNAGSTAHCERWRVGSRVQLGLSAVAQPSGESEHFLPLVTAASSPANRSFIRLINHPKRPGTVRIDAALPPRRVAAVASG